MRRGLAGALLLFLLLAGGCGGRGGEDRVTLRVFAASSLTGSFTTLAHEFERAHPGVRVALSFGPSSGLAEQVQQGAPADVFASASTSTMDEVVKAGEARSPHPFAVNRLEIAVPPGNPAHVHRLADLARKGVSVAVCQAQVPCGTVAAQVFHAAGLVVHPVTEEVDVKSVLTKVRLGEVDAGLVYVTDVRAAGDAVQGVIVPAADNARTTYPIARLAGSAHPAQARAFVDLVLSRRGASVLRRAGFALP